MVGNATGEERAGRATQQHGGHVEAAADVVRVESFLLCPHRAIDHPTVIAEEKTSECGDRGKQGDTEQVGGGVRGHAGWVAVSDGLRCLS